MLPDHNLTLMTESVRARVFSKKQQIKPVEKSIAEVQFSSTNVLKMKFLEFIEPYSCKHPLSVFSLVIFLY